MSHCSALRISCVYHSHRTHALTTNIYSSTYLYMCYFYYAAIIVLLPRFHLPSHRPRCARHFAIICAIISFSAWQALQLRKPLVTFPFVYAFCAQLRIHIYMYYIIYSYIVVVSIAYLLMSLVKF